MPEKFTERPKYHTFSYAHILIYVELVLSSTIRMRAASRAMEVIPSFLELDFSSPSWYAGRLWILRIGLYKLERPKQISNDWIWIIDHTVQLGKEKCLVILGIRQENLPPEELHPAHKEMEPIALFPVTESNGDIVFKQLEEAAEKTGTPRQIVSDHGTDVKSGIEKFCRNHENVVRTYDIKHKGAAVLRRELEKDPLWKQFTGQASQTGKKVQQTDPAFLAPPNQRSKARYMNVDTLVKWGNDAVIWLDQAESKDPENFEKSPLFQKIGWIYGFQNQLKKWGTLIDVISEADRCVNFMGLERGLHIFLRSELFKMPQTRLSLAISLEMIQFVKEQEHKLRRGERLLGSSEIIESVIGKYKRLQHDQVKGGFTAMLLGLAASVSDLTLDTVRNALDTISTKNLRDWLSKNIGPSVFTRKKEMRRALEEQKLDENLGCL